MPRIKDRFNRNWIIENSLDIVPRFEPGELTIRGLHYKLVSRGMTNTPTHYHRVISAMIKARWDGLVPFDTFSDYERGLECHTSAEWVDIDDEIERGKDQVKNWMECYYRNRWENQPYYPEVFIEKKTLLGVLRSLCERKDIALGACKGYPSLTFLNESKMRFQEAVDRGQIPVILYFGDYDPSGEDIPRSINENLLKLGVDVEVRRFALLKRQIIEWNLPPAPTKKYEIGIRKDGSTGYIGDARDKHWDGLGQVELDAVDPKKLQQLCSDAIDSVFDEDLYQDLLEEQSSEREKYKKELKEFVENI